MIPSEASHDTAVACRYKRSNWSGSSARDGITMPIAGPGGNTCWPGRATKAVIIPAHAAPATSHPWAATSRHSDTSAPTRPAAQRYTSACGLYFPRPRH